MPRKTKLRSKRKGGKRAAASRPRRNKRVMVNNALQPVPQRFITKMKYAETIQTDAAGRYVFNLNSLFDPNRTGIGHQPYGYDTLATLYNRYRVIACGYRLSPLAAPGTGGTAFQVAAMPANEVLAITSLSEMKENPRAKYVLQTAGGNSVVLKGKTYIPSLVGRTKAQYMADDRYQATTGANPSELAILNVMTSSTGDAISSTIVQVLLEYTVEFFDIKHLAQS